MDEMLFTSLQDKWYYQMESTVATLDSEKVFSNLKKRTIWWNSQPNDSSVVQNSQWSQSLDTEF